MKKIILATILLALVLSGCSFNKYPDYSKMEKPTDTYMRGYERGQKECPESKPLISNIVIPPSILPPTTTPAFAKDYIEIPADTNALYRQYEICVDNVKERSFNIEEYDLEISQEGIDAIKKELGVEEEPIRTDKHTKLRGHNTQQEIFATGDSHLIFSVYREQDSDKIYAQRFSYNPKSTVPRRQ